MKKLLSCLFAAAAVFGTAASAEFYNDLEEKSIHVIVSSDGMSFLECGDSFDTRIFEFENIGDGRFKFSRDGDEMTVTDGSDTAVFNGEKVKMPAAAYTEGEYICVPARFLYETFGAHAAYDDRLAEVSALQIYAGRDVQPVSGLIGDSFNNWSITLPEGWFCYTDSVDGNVMTINNFEDIEIEIEMYGGSGTPEPVSVNLEDYLKRTEFMTGADGRRYYLTGCVYSNPTDETRAELNAIMDSFAPEFTAGARDMSNISADGTKWEIASFRPGVAFDIPLGWDTYDYYAGYDHGERIRVTAEVYADAGMEGFLDKLGRFRSYFGLPELNAQPYELNYNGFDVTVTENELDENGSKEFIISSYIEDGGNVYQISVSTTVYGSEQAEIPESFKEKARESMYTVLDTLRLSDPGDDADTFEFEENSEPREFTVGELKFTVPGTLAQYAEFEAYEEGSGLTASAPYNRSGLLIVYIPGLYDELPVEEITELSAETETVTINGIEFFHVGEVEVYDDSPYIYEVYISIDENIVIMFSTEKEKADSPFAKDLVSVIRSVHK